MFDSKKTRDDIIIWIQNWFEMNGPDSKAVIGISGGKDSSVVAALCVKALGKDRVLGVLMPQGNQHDISFSYDLVNHLDIKYLTVDIKPVVDSLFSDLSNRCRANVITLNSVATTNTPARIRMTTLYAVAACVNGRVANTCNASEDYIGYSTKYGDSAGDFCPISDLTVTEVKQVGYELSLPQQLIEKAPEDGLSGKTDEDNIGFSYDVLDKYIRTGVCHDAVVKNKIDRMFRASRHKVMNIPYFMLDITGKYTGK